MQTFAICEWLKAAPKSMETSEQGEDYVNPSQRCRHCVYLYKRYIHPCVIIIIDHSKK